MTVTLAGTEDHPQARMVLSASLASGQPSHAYLFHGPAGTGKRTVARAFAAELLAEGSDDPDAVRTRVMHGAHPDLTWVRPSGAHVMRVDDVEGPVVNAAYRTPFEARRRVFVLERVDTMNDEVANRLLKTLEEPASYVHLILMTDQLGRVLETVISRCQLVRFEPLPAATIASHLEAEGVPAERRSGMRGLVVGQRGARSLSGVAGRRAAALGGRGACAGSAVRRLGRGRRAMATAAGARRGTGLAAEEAVAMEAKRRLELEPKGRERKAIEKEFEESAKRDAPACPSRIAGAVADADRADVPRPDLPGRGRIRRGAGRRPSARAGRAGPKPRPAPAARGGRALRRGAPVAGAERDRGPGAVGAGLQARGAGAR